MFTLAHFTVAEIPGLAMLFGSGVGFGLLLAKREALGRRALMLSPLLVLSAAAGVFLLP